MNRHRTEFTMHPCELQRTEFTTCGMKQVHSLYPISGWIFTLHLSGSQHCISLRIRYLSMKQFRHIGSIIPQEKFGTTFETQML